MLARQVWSIKRLENAWLVISENARASKSVDVRKEVDEFAKNASSNIRSLSSRLSKGTFKFDPALGLAIPKIGPDGKKRPGKIRPIVLAPLPSRIVQRAILDVLCDVPALSAFVNTQHSFGGLKKLERTLGAVPASIQEILDAIGSGANYVVSADIRSFFTRIEKSKAISLIEKLVDDPSFIRLINDAIQVELRNMAELRAHAGTFPIEDIGVAQGNSLSPLLGNLILHDFDEKMNEGDCRCIRYIDDFIILAPTAAAAGARLRRARSILAEMGMELSPEKSSKAPTPITQPFSFLGIELASGLIRPSADARRRLIDRIRKELSASVKAFKGARSGKQLDPARSLIATLRRVDGIVNGWGKHYRFCNDGGVMRKLDEDVADEIRTFLGVYRMEREKAANEDARRRLLGIQQLETIKGDPLKWPSRPRLA